MSGIVNFKTLEGEEWDDYPGKISGSAQPGYEAADKKNDQQFLKDIRSGLTPEEAGVDKILLDNLDNLNAQGIDVIYSLAFFPGDRHPQLIKIIWESRYPGMKKEYITEIDGVDIGIDDFKAPTQAQLINISKSAIENLKQGKNILVHCGAGIGRTGTVLAGISMLAANDFDPKAAVHRIRDKYLVRAVEGEGQINALEEFSYYLRKEQIEKALSREVSYDEMQNALINSFNLELENYVKGFLSKSVMLDKEAIQKLDSKGKEFALSFAAENKDLSLVRQLLEAGADVNFRLKDNRSLFSFALDQNDPSLVEYICNNFRFELNSTNEKGKLPLVQAIENKNSEIVTLLITNGADLKKIDPELIEKSKLSEYLLIAIEKGNFQAVKNLIDFEPSLYNQKIEGRSLLSYSLDNNKVIYIGLVSLGMENDIEIPKMEVRTLISNQPELIEKLIEQGVDTDKFRVEEELPRECEEYIKNNLLNILKKAIDTKNLSFIENLARFDGKLLKCKFLGYKNALDYAISIDANLAIKMAEIGFINEKYRNHSTIVNALELAIKYDNYKAIEDYLNKKAKISAAMLYNAIVKKNLEIVKMLVKHGAKINEKSYVDYPIIDVIKADNAKILDFFLAQKELNLSVSTYNNSTLSYVTPLMHAVAAVSPEMIRKLVARGADVNQVIKGETAINFAARNNKPAMLEILMRDYGADPNLGDNPLFAAKSEACIRLLIKHGVDVNAIHKNKTILEYAFSEKKMEVFEAVIRETCANCGGRAISEMIETNIALLRPVDLDSIFATISSRKDREDILNVVNDAYEHTNNIGLKQAIAKYLNKEYKEDDLDHQDISQIVKNDEIIKEKNTLLPPNYQKTIKDKTSLEKSGIGLIKLPENSKEVILNITKPMKSAQAKEINKENLNILPNVPLGDFYSNVDKGEIIQSSTNNNNNVVKNDRKR